MRQDLSQLSTQKLREEFWRYEAQIRESRERPKTDTKADSVYGDARRGLVEVAELLCERYDTDELEIDDKPWTFYL